MGPEDDRWVTMHAWVLDGNGHVVDTVWEHEPSTVYVGVELPTFELPLYGRTVLGERRLVTR